MLFFWAALLCAAAPIALAQQPPADEQSGLIVTFESLDARAKHASSDARPARLIALFVPAGQVASPFTRPGPFKATFEGEITLRLRTYVRFSAQGRGHLTLSLGGKPILDVSGDDLSKNASDEVRLGKGKNHIVAVYQSPAAGDAEFRLFWSAKTWAAEPVPPAVLSHSSPDPATARSLQVREGRALLAEFRCLKCHVSPAKGEHAMPELAMDAPSFTDIGARLNQSWLAAWIHDPRSLRPDAQMPRLFHGNPPDPRAADIAAYLASLGKTTTISDVVGNVPDGGRVFANLDCIACHTAPGAKPDPTRISLDHVSAKFKKLGLEDYLLKPEAHFAWNPMPNFHLSPQEASDLSAYLTSIDQNLPRSAGDAAKGKQWVESMGCLNCHTLEGQKSAATFPALASITNDKLATGCLAADEAHRGSAPEFALSEEQQEAIVAFLQSDRASLNTDAAPEFAERQIHTMRCLACHARDGNESLISQQLSDESQALHAKFPNPPAGEHELLAADQRAPMLTWAGEKLRPDWMAQFIGGRIPYKPRYYLRARMPSFPARAQDIAFGLAEEHGCAPALPPQPAPDTKLAEIGRQLCGKTPNQGFSCVQCHAAGDQAPFAAFEAPAINLKYISQRLRLDYYNRWIRDPQRIDPTTKMPRFEDDEGKTGLPAFDNDGQKQFDAIWQYLLGGEQLKPPT